MEQQIGEYESDDPDRSHRLRGRPLCSSFGHPDPSSERGDDYERPSESDRSYLAVLLSGESPSIACKDVRSCGVDCW